MRAIDIHCHPMTKEWFNSFSKFTEGIERMFHTHYVAKTEGEMADDFRRSDVKAMVIAWDSQSATGGGVITNAWVASLTEKFPDVFLPGWAVVDPWKGKAALEEMEWAITKLGLRGAKFQPQVQLFAPNDHRFYPMWDTLQSLGAPMLVHTGTSGLGVGLPGGGGVKLKYGRPIPYVDDVAADFPELTIIAAHPAWPWTEELIAMLLHKTNVYFDISGWRPKYIPEVLKKEINGRLQDKVMFGSDYPSLMPGDCLDELEQSGFKPEVIEKMFHENARRILKISDQEAPRHVR